MQTEITTLPTVCLNARFPRTQNPDSRIKPVGTKPHSNCKNAAFIFPNRKQLHPIHGSPYGNSARCYLQSDPSKQSSKSAVTQRIVSAKMLRIKELQNQLTDAHYHLNELANENRLLKVLQKRQDSALRRYEGTNAELPRIINSHHEELRILQSKYKKLRTQHKNTCEMLKEKENELHSTQMQNKHLLQLSKDRHLGEREKLQMKVSDLNYRIEQQDETIKTLNRKLAIEIKYLKHQLHFEVTKHKETQKQLQEALEKLKNLEGLLGNKEKRLLCNNQLNLNNKGQNITSQSLSNLYDNSLALNFKKSDSTVKNLQNETQKKLMLNAINEESNDHKFEMVASNSTISPSLNIPSTETMANLQHVRNFRLQKSSNDKIISTGNRTNDLPGILSKEDNDIEHISHSIKLKAIKEDLQSNNRHHPENESKDLNQAANEDKGKHFLMQLEEVKEYTSLSANASEDEEKLISQEIDTMLLARANASEDEEKLISQEIDTMLLARQSKELHARLTSKAENNFDIVNFSFNLESKTDSLTIEDIDKLISSEMLLYEVPNSAESSEMFVEAMEANFDLKNNYPSKVSVLNSKSKNSLNYQETLKDQSCKNIENNVEINGYEITNLSAIKTILGSDLRESSSKEQQVLNQKDSPQNKGNMNIKDRNTEIPISLKSSDILKNMEITSSQEHRVSIKHSISEESKPDKFHSMDAGIKNESIDTLLNEEISKDIPNHGNEEVIENKPESNESLDTDTKINYNKEKLLAAMKAIDNNENIEFLDHGSRKSSISSRSQITENLYRGLPAHSRKKEIIRDLFEDGKLDKSKGGCTKLH